MIIFSLKRTSSLVLVLSCMGTVLVSASNNGKDAKESSKVSPTAKPETVWNAKQLKATLKRETPISSVKLSGGKSSETLRTASQNLFGYNGQQGGNGGVGGFGGNGYNGFGNQGFGGGQFGFAPNYINGGGAGGRVGQGGFNQYSQLGNQAYNVLDQQNQGGFFGAAQGQNPYYSNNYFGGQGGQGGFGGSYNPYSSGGGVGGVGGVGGGYPFGSPQGGGFGGFGGFGNQGFYPGAQYNQGQVGQRNFGFVNQGFGNPAFRNPQVAAGGTPGGSIPSNVQVGTGLEVGSRGFTGTGASAGGFPSASGQQYIVGNGIGQPAFIGGAAAPGQFGFGSPYQGMYSGGIPGGLYRQQSPNSIFGLHDYNPRPLSGTPSPASITSRPNSPNRLQTSGPNPFYQGVRPAGTYASNSRERLYRFTTSNEN